MNKLSIITLMSSLFFINCFGIFGNMKKTMEKGAKASGKAAEKLKAPKKAMKEKVTKTDKLKKDMAEKMKKDLQKYRTHMKKGWGAKNF